MPPLFASLPAALLRLWKTLFRAIVNTDTNEGLPKLGEGF